MRRPHAPFLELQFYFCAKSDAASLHDLALALHESGASFAGQVDVQYGPGIATRPFSSVTSEPVDRVPVSGLEDLLMYFADPDVRVVRIYMAGATGTTTNVAEVVTYLDISPAAARRDRHPVGIWTDGDAFSGALLDGPTARARQLGRRIYERFLAIVRTTNPEYAAITSEYNLQCLTDLQEQLQSEAFQDFYIRRGLIKSRGMQSIQRLYDGAYMEEVGQGIYVSTVKEFNPLGRECDVDWRLQRSNAVARLLAQAKDEGIYPTYA